MGDNSAYTVLAIAVVGVLATCVGALVWVIKFLFQKLLPAFDQQTKVTGRLVTATAANTKATRNADTYLRSRNGRDAEFQKENLKALRAVPKQIIESARITAKILATETHAASVAVKKVKTDLEAHQ